MHYNPEQGGGRVGIARKGRMDEYNAEKEREEQVHESRKNTRLKELKRKNRALRIHLKICRPERLSNAKTDRNLF